MARRTAPPSKPERPTLTVEQKRRCIERLRQRIQDLEAFDPTKVQKRYRVPEVMALEAAIDEALSAAFGHGTVEYRRYNDAATLDHGPHTARMASPFGRGPEIDYDARDAHEARRYFAEGKEQSLVLLKQAIRTLEDEIADAGADDSYQAPTVAAAPARSPSKIFIVHGHDEGGREAVARFILQIGLEPVILHERPNKGRTIITKFREEAADIGFAVIVMTPDDIGKPAHGSDEPRSRPRQNVVFELGFFIGALGADRVAALVKGEIERPSDYDGVVYISLDSADWRMKLGQELQAAGYAFDWNAVMRA
jgi:predicted nucleotide-binding protein